jgi:hypothetical protein
MKCQAVDWASTNPHTPRLRIGKAFVKPIGSTQAILTDFKFARFDVDRDNLAPVVWLDLKPNFGFIEGIPPPGEFFFAISGLSLVQPLLWRYCHRVDLITTASVQFNLGDRQPVNATGEPLDQRRQLPDAAGGNQDGGVAGGA